MANRLTKGKALFGALRGRLGGMGQFVRTATLTRTSTAASNLFSIPKDAVIFGLTINGALASNAGTTAVLNVGYYGGTGHELLQNFSVLGATGAGQQNPTAATLPTAALTADQPIQVTYSETGTASSAGGPWLVSIEFSL